MPVQADRLQMCRGWWHLLDGCPGGRATPGSCPLRGVLCLRPAVSLLCLTSPSVPAVYVVEERRRDDTGESACLTACWTALCCCCLWDMLT